MIKQLLLTASVVCLTGCTVGPDYNAPSQSFLDTWFSSDTKSTSPDPISTQWWSIFEDPLLEQYIAAAAENNYDLKIALANVRRVRALRKEQRGSLFPQINSSNSTDRSQSTGAFSNFNGGEILDRHTFDFDASWEIDIFGGNRRSIEAAEARIGESVAEYQDVMLSTLSEVARIYYEARGLQKRIAITEQNTQLLKETFDVIQDRMEIGETSDFDLARAQGEYELTRARIPNLQAELRGYIYSLSVLLGQPPEALLAEMEAIKPLPTPPDIVPVGLRSDILRRRPDIRIAERALAASVADIGVEKAELFPKFFLTGGLGSQAQFFGDLFTTSARVWSLGSAMQWTVFGGGTIHARIDAQDAESEAALAQYEKSVLEALQDAETALTRYGEELETRKRLAQAVLSRRKALTLAKELFNAGEEDYLAVVDTERELIDSEDDLIISETTSITKLIALHTALGGGWEHFD